MSCASQRGTRALMELLDSVAENGKLGDIEMGITCVSLRKASSKAVAGLRILPASEKQPLDSILDAMPPDMDQVVHVAGFDIACSVQDDRDSLFLDGDRVGKGCRLAATRNCFIAGHTGDNLRKVVETLKQNPARWVAHRASKGLVLNVLNVLNVTVVNMLNDSAS
eukprot:GHVU01126212.1.p1 GENE.GHVU01126212.1~~GHVU01126212.1.p1  ORF type:complete len:166 (-),score=10.22 GHVU01126212.1:668-1165(-)